MYRCLAHGCKRGGLLVCKACTKWYREPETAVDRFSISASSIMKIALALACSAVTAFAVVEVSRKMDASNGLCWVLGVACAVGVFIAVAGLDDEAGDGGNGGVLDSLWNTPAQHDIPPLHDQRRCCSECGHVMAIVKAPP